MTRQVKATINMLRPTSDTLRVQIDEGCCKVAVENQAKHSGVIARLVMELLRTASEERRKIIWAVVDRLVEVCDCVSVSMCP